MNDFFQRLAARSLDSPPAALPRIGSRYETPGWDRSPQEDTEFAASPASERPPFAPAAIAARRHTAGTALDASPLPADMRDDGVTTSSSGAQVFAADAKNAARKTVPHMSASNEAPFESHGWLNTIERGREALAMGPERSGQLARASQAAIPAADQLDRSSEAFGPVAPTSLAGIAPATPTPMSRHWDEARNASSDVARVTPPSTDEAPAGLVRAEPGGSQQARSRAATLDPTRTMADTPPMPEIHVSIGRIEVRAVMPPVTTTPRPRASATGPALSLEAYLRERQESTR